MNQLLRNHQWANRAGIETPPKNTGRHDREHPLRSTNGHQCGAQAEVAAASKRQMANRGREMNPQQGQVPRCASRYDFEAGIRTSLFAHYELNISVTLTSDDMIIRDSQP
jgi:hypothetical protein